VNNREIIERVQSIYSKGAASDDTRLSSRHIYSKLKSAKALIIKRELDKKRRISDFNFDYLECVPMEKAQSHDCPCAPPAGHCIYKSKCKIPDTVTYRNGAFIQAVTSVDGSTVFNKTTWEWKQYRSFNRYVSPEADYFIKNNYIYVTRKAILPLKGITLKGIFTDEFDCNTCPCEDVEPDCTSMLDKEFNLEPDLIDVVVELTVQELLKPYLEIKADEENDKADRS
jgi:hypothetical protein